jgi:hypothetical protein
MGLTADEMQQLSDVLRQSLASRPAAPAPAAPAPAPGWGQPAPAASYAQPGMPAPVGVQFRIAIPAGPDVVYAELVFGPDVASSPDSLRNVAAMIAQTFPRPQQQWQNRGGWNGGYRGGWGGGYRNGGGRY